MFRKIKQKTPPVVYFSLISFFSLLIANSITSCTHSSSSNSFDKNAEIKAEQLTGKTQILKPDNQQIILTVSDNWQAQTGVLYRFENIDSQWQQVGKKIPIAIGRTGLAWGIGLHPKQYGVAKKEGDGKAPAGIFTLGNAFGYLAQLNTDLTYKEMTLNDFCIDVNNSPYYNQIVSKLVVGAKGIKGSSEPMRRDIHLNGDHKYKKGIIVEHNVQNISASGSCIFMHIWQAPTVATAGCTAMDESNITELLAWLDPQKNPLYIALPVTEYLAKKSAWALPNIKE